MDTLFIMYLGGFLGSGPIDHPLAVCSASAKRLADQQPFLADGSADGAVSTLFTEEPGQASGRYSMFDDRRISSGIIFINRTGLRWSEALNEYGQPKTPYSSWKRRNDKGVFVRTMDSLEAEATVPKAVMTDAPYLKAHRGDKLAVEKGGSSYQRGRLISPTEGAMNTKRYAVTDADGCPLRFFMTAGKVSDYAGVAALRGSQSTAESLLADRGYQADWFRDALKDNAIKPCIPGRKSQSKPIKRDKRRYKRCNRIEIMFGRPEDCRRIATRYERCPKVFLSAAALAATVIFGL